MESLLGFPEAAEAWRIAVVRERNDPALLQAMLEYYTPTEYCKSLVEVE